MDAERLIQVCQQVATDMEADATSFDGKPFDGKTVAEYFGNQGAAIAALAHVVEVLVCEHAAAQLAALTPKAPFTVESAEAERIR